jgi:hypothetical protein
MNLTAMAWIAVSERLPPLNEDVLVHHGNGYIDIARLRDVSWQGEPNKPPEFRHPESRVEHRLVTHWMPLPAPPSDA